MAEPGRDLVERKGVAGRILLKTDQIRITRWRCAAGEDGRTGELRDPWHLISFTHTGSFMVHVKGQSQMIDATRAMVIAPGEPFRMTRAGVSTASGSSLSIHPDALPRLAPRLERLAAVGVPVTAFLLQHLLLRSIASDDAVEAALWVASRTVLAPPAAAASSVASRPKRRDTISDVQLLLAKRYMDAIRLDEVARLANRSLSHLCRTFKRETGMPMHHYLNRLRLRASLEDVLDQGTHLSALAHALGYSSHSHFAEAFRNEFRVTPSEVRRIASLPRLREMQNALERTAHDPVATA